MPQRRKTGRTPTHRSTGVAYIGGYKNGIVTTDPAGRQQVTPYNGDATTALAGDGTFQSFSTAGSAGSVLTWCEELGAYLIDR